MEWNQYNPLFPGLQSQFGLTTPFQYQPNGTPDELEEGEFQGDGDEWVDDPYNNNSGTEDYMTTGAEPTKEQNVPASNAPKPSVTAQAPATPKEDKTSAADKAAELRARLIAMRPTSVTPNRDKNETAKAVAPVAKEPADRKAAAAPGPASLDRKDSITDLDGLLAEGRAAAEAKAKQHNGDRAPAIERPASAPKQGDSRQGQTPQARLPNKPPPVAKEVKSKIAESTKVTAQKPRTVIDSPELGEIREDESPVEPMRLRPKVSNEQDKKVEENKNNASNHDPATASQNRSTQRVDESIKQSRPSVSRSSASAPSGPEKRASLPQDKQKQTTKSVMPTEERLSESTKPAGSRQPSTNERSMEQRALPQVRKATDNVPPQAERGLALRTVSQDTENDGPVKNGTGSTAAAYSHYFDDLDEWLEITGYHDRAYRKSALKRYKALRDLEIQREKIEKEAEVELQNNGWLPMQSARSAEYGRSSSLMAMPPPRLPLHSASKSSANLSSPTHKNGDSVPQTPTSAVVIGSKRPPPADMRATNGQERPEKLIRVDSAGHGSRKDDQSERVPFARRLPEPDLSPTTRRRESELSSDHRPRSTMNEEVNNVHRVSSSSIRPARSLSPSASTRRVSQSDDRYTDRRPTESELNHPRDLITSSSRRRPSPDAQLSRKPYFPSRARSPSPYGHPHWSGRDEDRFDDPYDDSRPYYASSYSSRGRGRGRGRGYLHGYESRGGRVAYRSGREPTELLNSQSLGLRNGDTRFFMIKSWTHDNVEASQQEGTWATQPKNTDMLTDAFNTSRNVILVFSVNKSTAFQGYARMSSLPGAAPTPSWVSNLLWASSPPFHVKWVTTTTVRFRDVGHLRNALNENQAVLVGRDGQEIEAECGAALCELMDEEAERERRADGRGAPAVVDY